MVQLKNSRNIKNRYKNRRIAGRGMLCSNCPEQKELSDEPINGDDNLKKLSEHLKKLNIKQPKHSNKNYIKF